MKNSEVADLLFKLSEMLELLDEKFKPRAYEKAARVVESLSKDIEEIHKNGKLTDLPSIGHGIAEKIAEYLDKGSSSYYKELKKKLPMDVENLSKVPGMGPKRIKLLYDKLKIKTLNDLKKAAQKKEIQNIKGLGEKFEAEVLKGIEFAKKNVGRFLLGNIMFLAESIKSELDNLSFVDKVEIAGSYRRRKETVGDLDFLIISKKPKQVMDFFVSMDDVAKVLASGDTKSSVLLKNNLQVDLRVVKEKEFGSALQYFTGNKAHNVEIRKLALKKGYTLNEYGLYTLKGKKWVAGKTEQDIYKKLGLLLIPPEIRQNSGEIEAAQKNTLPDLISYKHAKGDFQMHTTWSDGKDSILLMAQAAQNLGWKFITITDHVGQLGITNPLNEKRLLQQCKEIDKLNKKLDIHIFKGAEVDILKNGNLALSKSFQKKLDVVLASVHLATKMSAQDMTKRICHALEHDRVHILGHPTGRLLNQREGYSLEFEKLFDVAKNTNTYLDIDCHPERMDLSSTHVRHAKKAGCKFVLSTDSHAKEQLKHIMLGEAIARRGWLEKKDVLNTFTVKKIENELGKK